MSSPSTSPGVFLDSSTFGHFLNVLEPTRSYAWVGFALLIGVAVYTSTRSKGPYVNNRLESPPRVLTQERCRTPSRPLGAQASSPRTWVRSSLSRMATAFSRKGMTRWLSELSTGRGHHNNVFLVFTGVVPIPCVQTLAPSSERTKVL